MRVEALKRSRKRVQDTQAPLSPFVRDSYYRMDETRELRSNGPYLCRNVYQNIATLVAQVAANATGAHKLPKIDTRFGRDVVQTYV